MVQISIHGGYGKLCGNWIDKQAVNLEKKCRHHYRYSGPSKSPQIALFISNFICTVATDADVVMLKRRGY